MKHPSCNIWGNGEIPESTRIGAFCDIGNPDIGENCVIQTHVSIPPGWKIGDNVFIGPGARFANDRNPHIDEHFEPEQGSVGDGAMIGMGALIMAGVRIGKGARIGMGAVVLTDVPDGVTVVGNPAKPI